MTHHNLALKRTNSFKRNTDNNQHCCTDKRYLREAGVDPRENDWENCDKTEEDCADKRYLIQRIMNEIRRRLAGTITRNCAVVLLQIVCDLHGVIGYCYIEVVEAYDQQEVEYRVCRRSL